MIFVFLVFLISLILFSLKKEKNLKNYKETTKFAVILPARNEEKVIDNILDSLIKQKYPRYLYDIYVIPNNCTDKTEEIASKKAKVLKYNKKFNNKGEVLKEAFKELKNKYDAYIIFDTDNIVDKNFLKEMNNSYKSGFKVCQGYRDIKNSNYNYLTYSYSIFYWFQNLVFSKSNSYISGSGFMISNDIIKKYKVKTLAEDIEFGTICELNNIKIGYNKKAITYDEQPVSFKVSWIQRKRWTVGVVQVFNLYIKDVIKKLKINSFFALMNPINNLVLFIIFLFNYNNLYFFILLYLFLILVSLVVIIYNKKNISIKILFFPIFMFSWMIINIIYLFKKDYRWQEIKHNG